MNSKNENVLATVNFVRENVGLFKKCINKHGLA